MELQKVKVFGGWNGETATTTATTANSNSSKISILQDSCLWTFMSGVESLWIRLRQFTPPSGIIHLFIPSEKLDILQRLCWHHRLTMADHRIFWCVFALPRGFSLGVFSAIFFHPHESINVEFSPWIRQPRRLDLRELETGETTIHVIYTDPTEMWALWSVNWNFWKLWNVTWHF